MRQFYENDTGAGGDTSLFPASFWPPGERVRWMNRLGYYRMKLGKLRVTAVSTAR
jgi:hypothetical protein